VNKAGRGLMNLKAVASLFNNIEVEQIQMSWSSYGALFWHSCFIFFKFQTCLYFPENQLKLIFCALNLATLDMGPDASFFLYATKTLLLLDLRKNVKLQ